MTVPSSALNDNEAANRLQELGITSEELREALRIGYGYAAGCTGHDPRTLPGILAWGKGTGNLRDAKKTAGWTPDSTENLETVVHPTNSHAVALAAGTAETGRRDASPRTKTPRGPATSRIVDRNAQMSFVGEDPAFGETVVRDEDRATWILLHYYDKTAEEIRCELSCPSEMKGKQVTGWRERILLDPVPFAFDLVFDSETDDDDDIDIDIPRRAD